MTRYEEDFQGFSDALGASFARFGFAVVAEEVQRLAERAGNATRQIETLVKTIQADTNEAIVSMERSTTNVVSNAQLSEYAEDDFWGATGLQDPAWKPKTPSADYTAQRSTSTPRARLT